MANLETTILASRPASEFLGRTAEIQQLLEQAAGISRGVLILSPPGGGKSELLLQVFDELFRSRRGPVPIYFALKRSDDSADNTARRFVREFLTQTVGFLRSDPGIVISSPGSSELIELAKPVAGSWFPAALGLLEEPTSGGFSLIKSRLNVAARAAAAGQKCFVMIDDLHEALRLANGDVLLEEIESLLPRLGFVLAANRKFAAARPSHAMIELSGLPMENSSQMIAVIAGALGVETNDQTRDLMSVQFEGNPRAITSFLERAAASRSELQSFRGFSALYGREIVGGSIGQKYDELFRQVIPEADVRRAVLERLFFSFSRGELRNQIVTLPDDVRADLLRVFEIDAEAAQATEHENHVLRDYLTARFRTLVEARRPSAVMSDLVTENLKRAPRLMAQQYRKAAALGLRELLLRFDCQSIPTALLDYGVYRDRYKGREVAEVWSGLARDVDVLDLPQLVHADDADEYYPPIAQIADADRTVVAVGFIERRYTDDDEVAWLAAEIDSKLEATRDVAEFWLDRLEMVAMAAEFPKFKIWLIAPEGFDEEALAALRARRAFGSSRKQAELLMRFLNADGPETSTAETDEYEIVVPMGGDTELIAAHAVEEVAKRRNFPAKAVNQIKTALVEACINAAEHSLSPDGKIYQKFTVDNTKIVITVSNRGIRMTDRVTTVNEPGTGRRGWGLNLMKGLMDEVKIEEVDDGTRISMTKYLEPVP